MKSSLQRHALPRGTRCSGEARTARSPPTRVREATPPHLHLVSRLPPGASDWDDAAVARLMEEYEALKAERQALARGSRPRQRARPRSHAKIEAELEDAARPCALNRAKWRGGRPAVYADGLVRPRSLAASNVSTGLEQLRIDDVGDAERLERPRGERRSCLVQVATTLGGVADPSRGALSVLSSTPRAPLGARIFKAASCRREAEAGGQARVEDA